MKQYVYIVTTNDDRMLLVGYCDDIEKTIKFFKELPNLHENTTDYNRLVYVEEHSDKGICIERFDELMAFTRDLKEAVIDSCNPDWIELKPGINFELI